MAEARSTALMVGVINVQSTGFQGKDNFVVKALLYNSETLNSQACY